MGFNDIETALIEISKGVLVIPEKLLEALEEKDKAQGGKRYS